jgi:phosphoribosylformylglycinamidine synthase subunit PurQ / glutaminase
MKAGVVVFPGSNCDHDTYHVLKHVLGLETRFLWHGDAGPKDCDLVVLPGGFSYGDYLRTGAIARFSPIMDGIKAFARNGGYVLGICNGFQILQEAGLLPGAMLRNRGLKFICRHVHIRVERLSPFSSAYAPAQVLRIPIAHNEGNFFAAAEDLDRLERNGQVIFRYCSSDGTVDEGGNPNGSLNNIAGVANEAGNVMGMMPHPERASEGCLGSADGKSVFLSVMKAVESSVAAGRRISL